MNKKDKLKMLDLVLNEQASLAGQYPEGNYYGEFAVICRKYDIDPETTWENVLDNLSNPDVEGYTVNKEGEYVKN
jgi:hypothetical protein